MIAVQDEVKKEVELVGVSGVARSLQPQILDLAGKLPAGVLRQRNVVNAKGFRRKWNNWNSDNGPKSP